jgi:hypothetical protein
VGGYADKIRSRVAQDMESSERLLGALRTMPRGTTMGAGIGGVVGTVVADRQAKKGNAEKNAGSIAEAWPMVRSAVALTDRRLLIYDFTFMGKPKDLVGQFPLDQLASLDVDKGVVNKVRFAFNDGSAVQVECAKLEKVGDFATAFEGARSGAAT